MDGLNSWLEKSINDKAIRFFDANEIEIMEKIGGGAFGHVHRAQLLKAIPPTTVAVKVFKDLSDFEAGQRTQEDLTREITLLRTVDFHENVLNFYGICKEPGTDAYMLVLEYADGGSLREYLSRNKALAGNEKIQLAKEIASGVGCLHKNSIIHRDLNSANILIHQDHVKIADLGLSKRVEVKLTPEKVTAIEATSRVQGHLQYIDPQCYIDMEYVRSKKSDIYSIGVVFWELSSCRIPFSFWGSTQAISRIINGVREEPIAETPQEFIDLYTKCWDQEPENRPDIGEVYEKLEAIEWNTKATSTQPVGSGNESTEVSTTISQTLGDIQIAKPMEEAAAIPEESTTILKRFFDAGKEADDIKEFIKGYLRENGKTPQDLLEMLRNEGDADENVTNHPHALLFGFSYYKLQDQNYGGTAFKIFERLAKDEDQYAQYFLGEFYRYGFGVNSDRDKALYWYEKSAKGGASNGQYELAGCYKYGWGVNQDIKLAKEWYQKAADKRHLMARRAINDRSWQTED